VDCPDVPVAQGWAGWGAWRGKGRWRGGCGEWDVV